MGLFSLFYLKWHFSTKFFKLLLSSLMEIIKGWNLGLKGQKCAFISCFFILNCIFSKTVCELSLTSCMEIMIMCEIIHSHRGDIWVSFEAQAEKWYSNISEGEFIILHTHRHTIYRGPVEFLLWFSHTNTPKNAWNSLISASRDVIWNGLVHVNYDCWVVRISVFFLSVLK